MFVTKIAKLTSAAVRAPSFLQVIDNGTGKWASDRYMEPNYESSTCQCRLSNFHNLHLIPVVVAMAMATLRTNKSSSRIPAVADLPAIKTAMAEAGLFPGINYYLSCCYCRDEFGVCVAKLDLHVALMQPLLLVLLAPIGQPLIACHPMGQATVPRSPEQIKMPYQPVSLLPISLATESTQCDALPLVLPRRIWHPR